MSSKSAQNALYVLVFHGSRDARSQQAAEQLTLAVQDRLQSWVALAMLECVELPLHQQLIELSDRALALGYGAMCIVPLFLLPGVHVMEDIPQEVAIARSNTTLPLILMDYLGSYPAMSDTLDQLFQRQAAPSSARILLAHGSRRPGGTATVEAIAHALSAQTAYWAHAPSLLEQVDTMIKDGNPAIAILPYILFPGGITDALTQQIKDCAQRYPSVTFQLLSCLGLTPQLVDMVVALARSEAIAAHYASLPA